MTSERRKFLNAHFDDSYYNDLQYSLSVYYVLQNQLQDGGSLLRDIKKFKKHCQGYKRLHRFGGLELLLPEECDASKPYPYYHYFDYIGLADNEFADRLINYCTDFYPGGGFGVYTGFNWALQVAYNILLHIVTLYDRYDCHIEDLDWKYSEKHIINNSWAERVGGHTTFHIYLNYYECKDNKSLSNGSISEDEYAKGNYSKSFGFDLVCICLKQYLSLINVDSEGYLVNYNSGHGIPPLKFYTIGGASQTIKLVNYGTNSPLVWYSFDKKTWNRLSTSPITFTSHIYVRGVNLNGFSTSSSNYTSFSFGTNAKVYCKGQVMSLINFLYHARQTVNGPIDIPSTHCFYRLFYLCSQLMNCPNLKCGNLHTYCYAEMFYGCTSLTKGPKYLKINNTIIACYYQMFRDCTSLRIAPNFSLGINTIQAYACYQMFYGCTSLIYPPKFYDFSSHITDYYYNIHYNYSVNSYGFYGMFRGCTSLLYPFSLGMFKSLYRSCYEEMFYGCTSLREAPVLPQCTLGQDSCKNMFYGCSKIDKIRVGFTNPSISATSGWLTNTSPKGVVIKGDSSITSSNIDLPTNWQLINHGVITVDLNGEWKESPYKFNGYKTFMSSTGKPGNIRNSILKINVYGIEEIDLSLYLCNYGTANKTEVCSSNICSLKSQPTIECEFDDLGKVSKSNVMSSVETITNPSSLSNYTYVNYTDRCTMYIPNRCIYIIYNRFEKDTSLSTSDNGYLAISNEYFVDN